MKKAEKKVPRNLVQIFCEQREPPFSNLGSMIAYTETTGKYSRPLVDKLPELNSTKSRSLSVAVSSAYSSKSPSSRYSVQIDDANGKNIDDLQKILRQERLVIFTQKRMVVERRLKNQSQ